MPLRKFPDLFSIVEVARRLRISPGSIRLWEKSRLFKFEPTRTGPMGWRFYSIEQVAEIKKLRDARRKAAKNGWKHARSRVRKLAAEQSKIRRQTERKRRNAIKRVFGEASRG